MPELRAQASLAERFAERREAVTGRSSALVPLRVGPEADTLLVFLDYWQIKNGLAPVTCRVAVFAESGERVHEHQEVVRRPHNELSFRRLLGPRPFSGMAEVEILSGQNLVFHWPALAVFYRSGAHYSAVHASGRVRNREERWTRRLSTETNWPCPRADGVMPFVHLFNGPRPGGLGRVPVRLMATGDEAVAAAELDLGTDAPYASRFVRLDEMFDLRALPRGEQFLALDLPDAEFFPRLVTGAVHDEGAVLEATHSFYWTTRCDYVGPAAAELELPSFVPLLCPPELELEIVSYPTNAPAEVHAHVRRARAGERLQNTGEVVGWTTGGAGARPWHYAVAGDGFTCLDLRGRSPSRLNATYVYRVRGGPRRFSTAVAWGAYAHSYPPRRSHWGPGLVSDAYETVMMVRNVAHRRGEAGPAAARLLVFDASGLRAERTLEVAAESATFLRLRELVGGGEEVRTCSWFLRSENPHLDTFWVSFAPEGSVCADHGF